MAFYQIDAPVSAIVLQYRPVREVMIARNGALLSAGGPRYDTLQEYIGQFASPVSMLRGSGLYTFDDPIAPECTLLVQCEPEERCGRCREALHQCECPF